MASHERRRDGVVTTSGSHTGRRRQGAEMMGVGRGRRHVSAAGREGAELKLLLKTLSLPPFSAPILEPHLEERKEEDEDEDEDETW